MRRLLLAVLLLGACDTDQRQLATPDGGAIDAGATDASAGDARPIDAAMSDARPMSPDAKPPPDAHPPEQSNCGHDGQLCCGGVTTPGDPCMGQNFCCYGDGMACVGPAATCAHCGAFGEHCCPAGNTCDQGLTCVATSTGQRCTNL